MILLTLCQAITDQIRMLMINFSLIALIELLLSLMFKKIIN